MLQTPLGDEARAGDRMARAASHEGRDGEAKVLFGAAAGTLGLICNPKWCSKFVTEGTIDATGNGRLVSGYTVNK